LKAFGNASVVITYTENLSGIGAEKSAKEEVILTDFGLIALKASETIESTSQ
jgi:hypothetical protein